MKTIYLRINVQGRCQPCPSESRASYAITNCPDEASTTDVANMANQTVIASPYYARPLPIDYSELGNFVNVYREVKNGYRRIDQTIR